MIKLTTFILLFSLMTFISIGQTLNLDSCGIDSNPILNKFEIAFIDSVFFAPIELKNGDIHDFTNGYDFKDKRLAFFDCADVTNNGFVTKEEFFKKIIPEYHGPHGITILKEEETGSYDAIITINCKMINENQLIEKLKENLK
ncbi:MAG: hypothetical protein K8R37_14540 [Bacteroidales bacterium]|nr:hypothetical protein [Bacteroidales bacterium]